jgi:hypothetical protein
MEDKMPIIAIMIAINDKIEQVHFVLFSTCTIFGDSY